MKSEKGVCKRCTCSDDPTPKMKGTAMTPEEPVERSIEDRLRGLESKAADTTIWRMGNILARYRLLEKEALETMCYTHGSSRSDYQEIAREMCSVFPILAEADESDASEGSEEDFDGLASRMTDLLARHQQLEDEVFETVWAKIGEDIPPALQALTHKFGSVFPHP